MSVDLNLVPSFVRREVSSRSMEQTKASIREERPLSATIVEEIKTFNGIFTAYQDGRIRARFADRTILNFDPSDDSFDIVDRRGVRLHLAKADDPASFDVAQYVSKAVEFMSWAFSSTEERESIAKFRESISREELRCSTSSAICLWLSQKRP